MDTSLQVIAIITIDVLIQDFVRNGATSGPARATASAAIFFLLMIVYLVCSLVLIYAAEKKKRKLHLPWLIVHPLITAILMAVMGVANTGPVFDDYTVYTYMQVTHAVYNVGVLRMFIILCEVPHLLVGGGGRKLPEAGNAGHHATTQQLARQGPISREFPGNGGPLNGPPGLESLLEGNLRLFRRLTSSFIRFLCSRMSRMHFAKE
ncbi:unnamed protein product [Darwinula stevensoni]|uniref:DUF7027 domain-containing protein n=1 Tax=Darwinula stevensoni TaxID=69355 RepID=A0A7R9ADU1_9CRUS|nr:unnamed protein product [Darwinula stevensoni]CAG0901401.1 unnamed protein product [Darwinula stevensoni]